MKYFIGRDGKGLFLVESPVEGDMLANRAIGAAYASLQMQAIREYQRREGDNASPVAQIDYEKIKNEPRSMVGLDVLLREIRPSAEISQRLIKEAYVDAKQRFKSVGVPL